MHKNFRSLFHKTEVQPKESPWSGEAFGLNLRFLLIVTVFVSNAIEPLIQSDPGLKALFIWIFTFHMPLFVGVTGYFARHNLKGHAGNKVLRQIALQYLIFQSMYLLFDYWIFKVPGITHNFFVPYLLIWFLMGHLIWRLVMRLFIHWNIRYPVLLSLAIGLLVGFLPLDGAWFALSRSFVYLPFFIIGYSWNFTAIFQSIRSWIRPVGLMVSTALLIIIYIGGQEINPVWLMNNMTYHELGWSHAGLNPLFIRLCIYGVEFIAAASFLAWVPQRICAITDLGKRTLYVFLIHGFIIRYAVYVGLYDHIHEGITTALLIAGSIACTILLAQPHIRKATHIVIEPNSEAVFGWVRNGAWRRRMKQS